eukprot:5586999-Prymnesium_polylepis.1
MDEALSTLTHGRAHRVRDGVSVGSACACDRTARDHLRERSCELERCACPRAARGRSFNPTLTTDRVITGDNSTSLRARPHVTARHSGLLRARPRPTDHDLATDLRLDPPMR